MAPRDVGALLVAIVLSAAMWTAALDPGRRAYAETPEMIEDGRRLFLEETFGGNGRTCGTCHPPDNNFTLDPAYIRTVRGNDPLFTAAPRLRGQLRDLEVVRLIREKALFLENVDGFDQPGVLRSVPHTLALGTSGPRFGWSGDGSPGDGSLRSFAIGAVIQHLPKSLNRVEGVDFRLPTEYELDALEAFQLSLGRQSSSLGELVGTPNNILLADLDFTDPTVQLGKERFLSSPIRPGGTRSCNGCHTNGGTNDGQRDTGVALLPSAPACGLGFAAPGDGGEGVEPVDTVARADLCGRGPRGGPHATVTFQGTGLFNTPTLIEAADTPPFFHNNAVATLEAAVAFYTTDTFHNSPAGGGRAFVLTTDEVNAIAALLRALNALENIRSSNAYAEQAVGQELERATDSIRLAIAETTDAIEMLTKGPVKLYAGTHVVPLLQEARELDRNALASGLRDDLIQDAIELRQKARDLMIE